MRAEGVAAAVLDIAFADSAPQSLNIVNPQRARWSDIMSSIRSAILEQKSLHSDRLTIVPFVEWVVRLEQKAAIASSEDLVEIVSLPSYGSYLWCLHRHLHGMLTLGHLSSKPALKLLEFFRTMARSDDELSQTQSSGSAFEAGGLADFSTTEAQRVSYTVLKMQPVGETEVRTWIQYWISKGLF